MEPYPEMTNATGLIGWADRDNVLTEDGNMSAATSDITAALATTSNYITVTNFNFNIPANATIVGYKMLFKRASLNSNLLFFIEDSDIHLIKGGGLFGINKKENGSWSTSSETINYGDTLDLWGTNFTPSDVNSNDFGVGISVNFNGLLAPIGNRTVDAQIDVVSMEVFFSTPLPVTLEKFDAKRIDAKEVAIEWSTIAELNNDYFTVERSVDGYLWEDINRTIGNGNSNKRINYQYIDRYNSSAVSYYRLKQTDYDGQFEYFDPVVVYNKGSVSQKVQVYASPQRGNIRIVAESGIKSIMVYSLTGVKLDEVNLTGSQESFQYRNKQGLNTFIMKVITTDGTLYSTKILN